LCFIIPAAAGSGIPEIKAFLNGVKLDQPLSIYVLLAKVLGMCLSVASSLPLGKEGPMIHAGSIVGAIMSQGWPNLFGSTLSWGTFQDFRNDVTKRDFITIGAAAGVAAAFKAPIGGILFTLEEGASFWSLPLTIRAFICAAITQVTVTLLFAKDTEAAGAFAFGQFDTLVDGRANYYTYELLMFILVGAGGGCLGALFNHVNAKTTALRLQSVAQHRWRRLVEVVALTFVYSLVTYILVCMWQVCTPLSDLTVVTSQEKTLEGHLVRFQCAEGSYNELATLFLSPADNAMQQLFHLRELDGGHAGFGFGPLILFLVPYFFFAAVTPGILVPTGLFIPTLLSGAAYGRLVGHVMNYIGPGSVADSGTYAFVGAASVLGGMSRMTISGTVILLEAGGNTSYLLVSIIQ
jgi:H+/Cl- antiporter ClcA